MKRSIPLVVLFLSLFLLSACGSPAEPAGDAWTVYRAANDTLVNPNFPAYSFEYPSYWRTEETANHIAFASEAKLLQDPPETMQPGQILVGLSLNSNMPPEEMLTGYTSTLESILQFDEPLSVRLNGRQAIYQLGVDRETGDALFVLAVEMGDAAGTRGLLTARMAEGEFSKWEEVLFKMAGSLQVEN
jgi:hypothetical protein